MKKRLIFLLTAMMMFLAACGNEEASSGDESKEKDSSTETITYESESGPVEVPADPKRVVVLSLYVGDLLEMGVNVVGMDSWSYDNPEFAKAYPDAEIVESTDYEKIIELEPDLIIGSNNVEDAKKLEEIAPTVLFTYGKLDYLDTRMEIGKVLNKEKEMQAWMDEFKERSASLGKEIKAKIGEDATVTVAGYADKQIFLFGDSWGRGTEILYKEMGLKMPEAVADVALEPGYFGISEEVLGDYVGEYLVLNVAETEKDTSFLESNAYKNISAVKNGNVFYANGASFYFADAYSLNYQLDFFEKHFFGK